MRTPKLPSKKSRNLEGRVEPLALWVLSLNSFFYVVPQPRHAALSSHTDLHGPKLELSIFLARRLQARGRLTYFGVLHVVRFSLLALVSLISRQVVLDVVGGLTSGWRATVFGFGAGVRVWSAMTKYVSGA